MHCLLIVISTASKSASFLFSKQTFPFSSEGALHTPSPAAGGCESPHRHKALCLPTHCLLTLHTATHNMRSVSQAWMKNWFMDQKEKIQYLAGQPMFIFNFYSLLQLLCYNRHSHSNMRDLPYKWWTRPSESKSTLPQPLGIMDVMSRIPCEPSILTVNRPQIPHLLNQLQMAHSSTFTEQVDSPTLQELRSSQSGRHKTLCGWHERIPAPWGAVSRWSRTYESDKDGKSHRKWQAWEQSCAHPPCSSSESKWLNCLLGSSL